jgi:hypothetical protein
MSISLVLFLFSSSFLLLFLVFTGANGSELLSVCENRRGMTTVACAASERVWSAAESPFFLNFQIQVVVVVVGARKPDWRRLQNKETN